MDDIFTSTNFSRDARLEYCEAYTEKDSAYVLLKLIYEYEDTDGLHRVIFPKVSTTITTGYIPIISSWPGFPVDQSLFFERGGNEFPILKADVHEFDVDDVYLVDKLIKPNTKEMTIEDIEKELGYKVKIVNKKDN